MDKQGSSVITLAVVGEPGVGKTTFINAFREPVPSETLTAEGVNIRRRNVLIGGRLVTLRLWETHGRVTQGAQANLNVGAADGVILMYAVNKWDTFAALEDSAEALQTQLGRKSVVVVGNSPHDLNPRQRQVSRKNGEGLAKDLRANFYEVDARESSEVQGVIENWTNELLCPQSMPQPNLDEEDRDSAVSMLQPTARRLLAGYNQRHFKVIVVGNSKVGKTSFIRWLTTGRFVEKDDLDRTKSIDIIRHEINMGRQSVKLQIWDSVAQERFHNLPLQYYRRVEGAIVMYDITNRQSYQEASKWAREIQKHSSKQIVVIGNKRDLLEQSAVKRSDGVKLAQSLSSETMVVPYFATSARTGYGVITAVQYLALQMVQDEDNEHQEVAKLQGEAERRPKSSCCS